MLGVSCDRHLDTARPIQSVVYRDDYMWAEKKVPKMREARQRQDGERDKQ